MEKHGKSWIWVSIGIVIVYYFFIWYRFFIGISSLFNTIFYTFSPLMVFFIIFSRISKHKVLINKIFLIGWVGFVITGVIWFFASYILIFAPWAPFYDKLSEYSKSAIMLILMGAIYGIVAYILYRFGKKRDLVKKKKEFFRNYMT